MQPKGVEPRRGSLGFSEVVSPARSLDRNAVPSGLGEGEPEQRDRDGMPLCLGNEESNCYSIQMMIDRYVTVAEVDRQGWRAGIDIYPDQSCMVHYWENDRDGSKASCGFWLHPAEIMSDKRRLEDLKNVGGEWFIPILAQIASGEFVDVETITKIVAEHLAAAAQA